MAKLCRKCKMRSTINKTGFCDKCEPKAIIEEKEQIKRRGNLWDKHNRISRYKRGYDWNWYKFRDIYLSNNPLCVSCNKLGIYTPATEIHHILPMSKGGAKYDESNLMPLCKSCHSKITIRES